MHVASARPGHVRVDRLSDEGVAEGRGARLHFGDEAKRDGLLEIDGAVELVEQVELEALPSDGRDLERVARAVAHLLRHHQDRVADRVRQRHLATWREDEPVLAGRHQLLRGERRDELLDEERHALRAVVDDRGERRCDRRAEDPSRELARRPPAQAGRPRSRRGDRRDAGRRGACESGGRVSRRRAGRRRRARQARVRDRRRGEGAARPLRCRPTGGRRQRPRRVRSGRVRRTTRTAPRPVPSPMPPLGAARAPAGSVTGTARAIRWSRASPAARAGARAAGRRWAHTAPSPPGSRRRRASACWNVRSPRGRASSCPRLPRQ